MVFTSCTYDYFVDETNFRIYVPQVKEGTIKNFYVSFHSIEGRHIQTRQLTAPFNQDELTKQGILRFKLPCGEYTVSCFADYTPNAITVGEALYESYKGKDLVPGASDIYASRSTNPRILLSRAMVYPLGHPGAKDVLEVNIDEKQQYKGAVQTIFKDLPDFVQRIDVLYKGLATKVNFDGSMGRFSLSDQILASFEVAPYRQQNRDVVLPVDILSPSVGINFGNASFLLPAMTRAGEPDLVPLELEIRFYKDDSSLGGILFFAREDFERLADDKKPTDANGNPVENLVLEPQKTIIFTFRGFFIIGITIQGWGDIVQGPITPM